ncbi:MAG: MFS transporter [Burkholderiaceae bacterium]
MTKHVSEREFTSFSIRLVAFCFLMNVVARGFSETFGVFLLPVTQDTGWSRSEVSGVYATFMLAIGLAAPFLGNLFDRVGGRVVYVLGLVIYSLGFLIASYATALWQYYLGLGLFVGAGVAAIGMAPSTALISRWFTRRMSSAMGYTNAGMGVGILIMAPLSHLLIEAYTWRVTYRIFSAVILLPIPFILMAPWAKIQAGRDATESASRRKSLWLPGYIFRTAGFWGLGAVFFFTSLSIFLVNIQLVAYLTESGFDPFIAASAYGAISTVSIVGIIFTGWLADLYGRKRVITISYSLTMVGIALLWLTGKNPVFVLLVPAALFYGLAMGARGPIVSTLVARLYPNNVAGVFGTISVGMGLGAGTGSMLSGALFDFTGGYTAGFMVSLISAALGMSQFLFNKALATGKHQGQNKQPA